MSTITIGATVITPTVVDGYESSRQSGNIVHQILGTSSPDVTFRPAQLRRGSLRLVFASEAAAKAAEDAHATAGTCELSDGDVETVDMVYVVDGEIRRTLDDATRHVWVVTVDFQEVSP